jgi:hypothetical protein
MVLKYPKQPQKIPHAVKRIAAKAMKQEIERDIN